MTEYHHNNTFTFQISFPSAYSITNERQNNLHITEGFQFQLYELTKVCKLPMKCWCTNKRSVYEMIRRLEVFTEHITHTECLHYVIIHLVQNMAML